MTLGIGLAIQSALGRIERVTRLGQQLVPSVGGYVVMILAGLFLPVLAVLGHLVIALYIIVPLPAMRRRAAGRRSGVAPRVLEPADSAGKSAEVLLRSRCWPSRSGSGSTGTLDEMPERYRAAILVAAWCGLRFGEFAELRRRDVDLAHGRLRVRRAVTHVDGRNVVGTPKSEAGVRDVSIPPHLLPVIEQHLQQHVDAGREALLFPAPTGGHLRSDSVLHEAFHAARAVAGRTDLTIHGLRHTGAALAAATGATLAELMRRLGHSTPVAAMHYQHATDDRDRAIAEALSKFHAGNVIALRPKEGRTA
jgi:integrase